MIAWQYTKELAYQMFLLNKPDLVDDDESEERRAIGFRNAKKRTEDILKEEYKIINPDLELKKELAICPFAKEKGTGGITFAHKTVYEYFTAVKLYEDYFARFDTAFFKANDEVTAAKEVMESFIEAFRYEVISDDIFNHLCDMNEAPLFSKLGYCKSTGLKYMKYENAFIFAMRKHMFAKIGMKPAVEEYLYASDSKSEEKHNIWSSKYLEIQMNTSYANFTWFLTKHGFSNNERIPECMLIGRFLYNSLIPACLKHWHLEGADLQYKHLEKAILDYAHLENIKFKGAYLIEAYLQYAHLQGANLTSANLFKAHLENSDLTNADFTYANLKRAHMNMANLTDAIFQDASLNNANLTRATLTSANFKGANMNGAHLNKANLQSADLQSANLQSAYFEYADLSKAVLKGSNLIDADFIKANLSDADLSYTDLSYANMSGTDLRLTNLTGAIMKSAKYCNDAELKTIFPEGFDPKEHDMIEVDIDGNLVKDE